MKLALNEHFLKGLPVAILVTLLLQGAAGVWWLSAKARDSVFIEQRVDHLENAATRTGESQGQTVERLARIEERLNAQTLILSRIERQLADARR